MNVCRPFKTLTTCSFSQLQEDTRGPSVIVVNGVAIPLPSYEEAVSGTVYQTPQVASAGPENTPLSEDQDPPSYPGCVESQHDVPPDPGEVDTCDSLSDTSECLHSMQPSLSHDVGLSNMSEKTNVITSMEETASTSPRIDIADGKHATVLLCISPRFSFTAPPWAHTHFATVPTLISVNGM